MRQVDVEWEGPFVVEYDREKDQYRLSGIPSEVEGNAQLYSFYGRHPVYGAQSLLYIGRTLPSSEGGGINNRIRTHLDGPLWYHTELVVHLGVASERNDVVADFQLIEAVESLLIAANMPALNCEHIKGPKVSAGGVHVVNWGFIGGLVPECSSRRFIGLSERCGEG